MFARMGSLLMLGGVLATVSFQKAEASYTAFPIPVSGGIFDMVYDSSRHLLYMTTGASNILRYDIGAHRFLSPITVTGRLQGLDISADGSMLAAADAESVNGKVWVDIVALATGKLTRISTAAGAIAAGTFDAAFSGSSDVVVSGALPPGYSGAGVPFYVAHLASGKLVQVGGTNATYMTEDTVVRSSPDHSVVGYTAGDISNGPWGTVNAAKAKLSRFNQTYWFTYDIAVAPKGAFYAVPTYYGTFVYNHVGLAMETIGTYAQTYYDSVVFDAVRPAVLYQTLAGAAEIDMFSVSTGKIIRRIETGVSVPWDGNGSFGPGTLRIAGDDSYLFMNSGMGVVAIKLP